MHTGRLEKFFLVFRWFSPCVRILFDYNIAFVELTVKFYGLPRIVNRFRAAPNDITEYILLIAHYQESKKEIAKSY